MYTTVLFGFQRLESRIEMEMHTHRFEPRPQPRQDSMKPIGPDMRPGVECDLRLGARRDEGLQNRRFECVLGSGVELAVGVGPSPAFSEEQIALGIELSGSLKMSHRPTALAKRRTTVDQVHSDAIARQGPRGIEARGPRPNDDDTTREPFPLEAVEFEARRGLDTPGAAAF